VRQSLDKQLGVFLRKQRGERTFADFSRKLGLPPSTLYRLERGEQSITLRKLQQILARLKCTLADIFGR
jgi:transcriptional regulator with XRE-family HTH domain